jgi:hypothetical protein
MKNALPLVLLVGLLSGCAASVPFERPAPVAADRISPDALVAAFHASLPDRFHLLNSIVFEYNWLTVAGIVYLELNRIDGIYKVSCMNHLGVKVFEFSGDANGLISQYAIEPLRTRGNITAIVGQDIRRMYLDLTPVADARFIRRNRSALFRQRSGNGTLEYEFSGDGLLTTKTYREDHRAVWRASYYGYRQKNGKSYPMGVVFAHYRYGYRLILRIKEILD